MLTGGAAQVTPKIKPRLPPSATKGEKIRIIRRRIDKAERDERVDLGMMLTQSKTYMKGFTRPRHLRALAWSKGGLYDRKGKNYEMPPPSAYEPHTVYLLEGRYHSDHITGRSESLEHVVGVCPESEFVDTLKRYNSERTNHDALRAMDFARWPWLPSKPTPPTRWWKAGEDPQEIVKEIHEGAVTVGLDVARPADASMTALPSIPATTGGFARGQQIRAFHSSARVLTPSSHNEDHVVPDFYVRHKQHRAKLTSAKSSTDVHVEAAEQRVHDPARQKAAIRARKHEEAGLMQHLSDSILSDEIAASTRRLKTKIPVEHYDAEGNLIMHPSGFVVPGNGHTSTSGVARAKERQRDEDEDRAAQTAAVAERVLESDLDYVHATMASTRPRSHKVPFEVREPDGVVKHPSGFVPPTPAHAFKYSDSASLDKDLSAAIGRQRARETSVGKDRRGLHTTAVSRASISDGPVPAQYIAPTPPNPPNKPAKRLQETMSNTAYRKLVKGTRHYPLPNLDRVVRKLTHERELEFRRTKPDPRLLPALEGEPLDLRPFTGVRQQKDHPHATEIREQYLPTLAETPFFRPLLTLTFATRPLADTIARLSRAGPRGLSYVAALKDDDSKYGVSVSARERNLRLTRMQDLSTTLAQLFLGARGGLMGVRFSHLERGRGVDGEGLTKPLPWEKRLIGVGVGNWYARAEEIKEGFREDGDKLVNNLFAVEGEEDKPPFKVYGLDDWGRRIADDTGEEIPYPPKSAPPALDASLAMQRLKEMEAEAE